MKKEDMQIKELYTEAYESIHASDEFKKKIIEMNNTNQKKGNHSNV